MLLNYHIRFVLGSLCFGDLVRLGLSGVRVAGCSLQHGHHSNPAAPNLQNTKDREQNDRCGNSTVPVTKKKFHAFYGNNRLLRGNHAKRVNKLWVQNFLSSKLVE